MSLFCFERRRFAIREANSPLRQEIFGGRADGECVG